MKEFAIFIKYLLIPSFCRVRAVNDIFRKKQKEEEEEAAIKRMIDDLNF